MCDFENKVTEGILNCTQKSSLGDLNNLKRIAAGVSGGADSVSLLVSLCNIFSPLGVILHVITVNHNIRPKNETCGDADFVVSLCSKLQEEGKLVECSVKEISRGNVEQLAGERKSGIEDAARFLRYKIFSEFCNQNDIQVLFLAHNKNDNLETVLMRFLQGGSAVSLCGIPAVRSLSPKTEIFRPLLQIERSLIEQYLQECGICWRNDSTNQETKYLRNKIRLKLIPFLNQEFPFWQNAVLGGMGKNRNDAKTLAKISDCVKIKFSCGTSGTEDFSTSFQHCDVTGDNILGDDENESFCSKSISDSYDCAEICLLDLLKTDDSIKMRILTKAMNGLGENSRIPQAFLKDLINEITKAHEKNNKITKNFGAITFFIEKNTIFLKKSFKKHTDLSFFDIIEESGFFSFPFGVLNVVKNSHNIVSIYINDCFCCEGISLPFIIRSFHLGDSVMSADNSEKKLSDVFSSWHVNEEDKKLIPIIQSVNDEQRILCILGSFLGYKNWIVKQDLL
ncbi:MAG: tRNA lysidine(34) synthetase TilS [Spirochaetia bacterium]|nr:tRNA lysidine(34) synthetase TilS [Spirochaetia bacterium]